MHQYINIRFACYKNNEACVVIMQVNVGYFVAKNLNGTHDGVATSTPSLSRLLPVRCA